MKNLLLVFLLLFSSSVFAKKCSEYFDQGEYSYLAAVDFNKQANQDMFSANEFLRNGQVQVACSHIESAVPKYQVAQELISEATFEMMGASRNCFWRRDRNRATDNLDLLKRSGKSVKENMDKGIALYRKYCE